MMNALRAAASRREKRGVHFDLSHSPAGVQHTLHIGSKRYILAAHDNDSRTRFRNRVNLLNHIPDERLTHYHPALQLHAGSIQSYRVTHAPKVGELPNLALLGIMIPKAVAQRAHQLWGLKRGLYTAKAQRLGLVAPTAESRVVPAFGASSAAADDDTPPWIYNGDLADFHDMTEAAVCAVYHHPNLITLTSDPSTPGGSDTATQVISIIESSSGFQNLVNILNQQGIAQNLDGWNEGYQGWANGELWLDANGNPQKDKKGNPLWWYVYTDQTNAAMTQVVQSALLGVRNQANLENISFKTDYGQQSITPTSVTSSVKPHPETGELVALAAATPSGYTYNVTDPDYHHGRQVVLGDTNGRSISFTLNNSYFRHLGVFVRFLGPSNDPNVPGPAIKLSDIPKAQRPASNPNDTAYDSFRSWVVARNRILGIPTEDAASAELTVTLPDVASSMMVLAGGMGLGSLPSSSDTYKGVQIPGAVMTGVLDLGLPVFFLAMGATSELVFKECGSAAAGLVQWIAEVFAPEIAVQAFNSGNVSKSDMQTDWAQDILKSLITNAPEKFTGLVGCAAAVAGEEDAFAAVPIIGQIIFAINVAATLADLVETTAICLSPWVITNEITSLMPVQVTINRDPDAYTFPDPAKNIKITATLSTSIAYDFTARLKDLFPAYPKDVSTITHTFEVPSGGQIQIDVSMTADNGWVAATGSCTAANILPAGASSLPLPVTLKENVIPINNGTHYVHTAKLGYNASGQHAWVSPSAPPTATVNDLGGNAAVRLQDLSGITINQKGRLGYAWSGRSPLLVPVGQASWPDPSAATPLYTAQNINLDSNNPVDFTLRIMGTTDNTQNGLTAPVFIVYDLLGPTDGLHFIVAPVVTDPTTSVTEYHAFKVSLDGTTPIDLNQLQSYGRFASPSLEDVAVHPRGFIVALNSHAEKVEILNLPTTPYANRSDALYANQVGGQGQYVGLLHGSKAISVTKDGNSFLVLEEVNQRIQFFSVNGTSISDYLPNQQNPWIPLNQKGDAGLDITWLAMSMENTGFLYVLSYVNPGSDISHYRMDIYDRDGNFVTRTTGVPAARLVVDKFRNVYTLNFELITGPNQRPEPSVSTWVAQNQ